MRQNSDVKKKNSCVCVRLYPPIVMIAVPSGLVRRRSHHIEPRNSITTVPFFGSFPVSRLAVSNPNCLFPYLCTHVVSAHVATMPHSIDCAPVPCLLCRPVCTPSSHKPECNRAAAQAKLRAAVARAQARLRVPSHSLMNHRLALESVNFR
jgi:hypothetical protein